MLGVATIIKNVSERARPFLWKLHPALAIEPGDEISCPARTFEVADPAWSRRVGTGEWTGETVPEFDGTTEFLYLSELADGTIAWQRGPLHFAVRFDPAVFPYAWYFASYGGFDGHHVAILEPCNTKPISVSEAHRLGRCPVLAAGATIKTTYSYRGWIDAG